MAPATPKEMMLQSLAQLLHDSGDLILDGTSTLTLFTSTLQYLTQIFEQHLISRNQNHGFIALSSHPAETSAILQAQFLFDVLQKTLSLKLTHVPDCPLPAVVNIFPFKSLRRLELKCVPLHCLRGLRLIYSQLEALTCSKCVNSLEEIISACGGDLSSALPWLELQTVNFSHNSIANLDGSLQLLNVLKALDLSHNLLQDCECHLTVLTDLEYLNVAYNFLPKIPDLGLHSRAKLVTLILRYNQLDSINGVEQLSSLQHLDVAYNLLLEHALLTPLSLLHNMKRLHLEGNPLWFDQNHRPATMLHLSPRVISCDFLLDGELLSASDLQHLSKLDQMVVRPLYTPASEKVLTDRSALESSCAADQSDSQSGESRTARIPPQKKTKGKVKVRRASISEPSDTDREHTTLPLSAGVVRQHQEEMERMDSFRDRFGTHWLQYRRHLEAQGQAGPSTPSGSPTTDSLGSSAEVSEQNKSPLQEQKTAEAEEGKEPELPHAEVVVESVKAVVETDCLASTEERDEEEKPEADLCQPVLVSQIEGDCDPEPDWIFLRVTARHVIEVELKAAKVVRRLELQNLQKIETSEMLWRRLDLERVFPVLTLHFNYICKDRQKRRYIVLDDHPERCVQELMQVLKPPMEGNGKKDEGQAEGGPKLQCLKCTREFAACLLSLQNPGPAEETPAFSEQGTTAFSEPIICPSCSSDHVVILPSERRSSTPLPPPECLGESQQEATSGKFYIGEENSEIGTSSSTHTQELSGDHGSAVHSSSRSSDGSKRDLGHCSSLSQTDTNGGSLMGSYRYGASQRTTPSQLSLSSEYEEHWNISPPSNSMTMRDFCYVDHRLKLYLDMEIFDKSEEFKCYLKVAVVKDGHPGEFLALLVASDVQLHLLEVKGEIRGQPSDWLKKSDCHSLSDISALEVGLCHQSLHIEFVNPCASYTLLLRNENRCRRFLQCLTYLMQELPSKNRREIPEVTVVEMNPHHPLWVLLDKDLAKEAGGGSAKPFFYLLAYLIQGASAFPVTLLSTHSNLFLVEEDHQRHQVPISSGAEDGDEKLPKNSFQLKESQPISSISGVILYRFSPCDMKLQLYDEVLKVESTWHLRTECPDLLAELVEWLRVPWEEMFSIALNKTVFEVLE
ncbi:serine/threonine-protein kinase 11-interacting protein [Eublepharis macularius]|uniref:Serine/threonine-protein kinase 11-interacting protein n=1 Tax=Eublepharis macularius TaxID=481883 RepID=A0AA97IY51_EUBMA|nr:serine/threonine-protein kinase 11-interacting protein [Eublepharis macularius]XP_054827784.1 serine/threonine-protein kinase 11-interacting protein [Eublepharis macularius]XP_054827785.1 serine/threonine-protein kinase 11-interacting protein [Eublepharis macularius]XP_054827786.1 serine/threonine-protein kinase 11-interacting protein [Eublepharis macularius]XP_054827787.1 serine/threonine-protein kinase 11-interacting protein [Eublepharis macularius]